MKFQHLADSIQNTHTLFQSSTVKAINKYLTIRNWLIGFYIIEFEQHGENRAKYGTLLLKTLEENIKTKGLHQTLFKLSRQFYLTYPQIKDTLINELKRIHPTLSDESNIFLTELSKSIQKESAICPTVSDEFIFPPEKIISSLSFSHIVELLPIENPLKRLFYEIEAIKCNWSVRELRRQINTQLYERCGISSEPEKLLSQLHHFDPQTKDLIKNPFTFEFLGLKAKEVVEEKDIEQALIDHLQEFILELGYGFCFEARQKRIIIDDKYYFADLVFYHRILHCHVIIELKNDEFKHEHLGQLNTYVSYYRKNEMQPGDNPPIGILLCTSKGKEMVEYAMANLDTQLFVSKYQIELPDPKQLKEFIKQELQGE